MGSRAVTSYQSPRTPPSKPQQDVQLTPRWGLLGEGADLIVRRIRGIGDHEVPLAVAIQIVLTAGRDEYAGPQFHQRGLLLGLERDAASFDGRGQIDRIVHLGGELAVARRAQLSIAGAC